MGTSTSSGSRREPQSPALRNGHNVNPTPSARTRSASVDPSALSRPSSISGPTSPSTMLSIAQLDNQIRTMTTQMDALVSERTTLIEAAARQRRVRLLSPPLVQRSQPLCRPRMGSIWILSRTSYGWKGNVSGEIYPLFQRLILITRQKTPSRS